MFTKLTLSNFQSHKLSCLEFTPGVNILVGESNSGKTSILRAILWCAFNKPSGNSFIRHTSEACSVELCTGEGNTIERRRGARLNEYSVNDTTYSGFGQNVPETVQDVINLSDINVMRQMDAPFMLSMTSGEVAQYLNSLVDLDIITSSVDYANSKHREYKQCVDKNRIMYESYNNQLKSLSWIDSAEVSLNEIITMENEIDSLHNEKEDLEKRIEEINSMSITLKKMCTKVNEFDRLVTLSSNTIHDMSILVDEQTKLETNIQNIVDNTCDTNEDKLYTIVEKYIDSIKSKLTIYSNELKEVETLNARIDSVRELKDSLALAEKSVVHCTNVYKQAMPETCPLCGAKTKRSA